MRQAGQLQQAADAFYQATQADPRFAPAFANSGGALLEGNNLQLATDYLQRALQLDPKLDFASYNLRLVREIQKDWNGAIAYFQQAITYSQNSLEPAYHLGMSYLEQRKIEPVKQGFTKAVATNTIDA